MLILLLPNQIAEKWGNIAKDLEDSLPPIVGTSYDMNSILNASLTGVLQYWLLKNEKQENSGLLITTVNVDPSSSTSMLMIYAAITYKGSKLGDWKSAYETLEKFAKLKGCKGIMGYSNNDVVVKYMKHLGCSIDQKLIMWRL